MSRYAVLAVLALWPQGDPGVPRASAVDLTLGESAEVKLFDGTTARVKLIDVEEIRDDVRQAIRQARVKVEVNGDTATLTSANYTLPTTVGGVQVDCSITGGYRQRARLKKWSFEKDARLRVWPAGSTWFAPGQFVYPLRQRWFASDTQFSLEPTFVNGDEIPGTKDLYYHTGLDIGGPEGLVDVVSATDGEVVTARGRSLPGYDAFPFETSRHVVCVVDAHGWIYLYGHLLWTEPEVVPGTRVKKGQKIGILGMEGGAGWSHLHFEMFRLQPSGKFGTEEGYAYLWEAYVRDYKPKVLAVARPHHLVFTGQKVTLDGTKSWSASGKIARYDWVFTDGTTDSGPKVQRAYDRAGHYSEVMKVTDAEGHVDYDFAVVQVIDREKPTPVPPTMQVSTAPSLGIAPRDRVTFHVGTFRTNEGEEVWDFGDGSPPVRTVSKSEFRGMAENGWAQTTHRYAKPGLYRVRVERSTKDGMKAVGHVKVVVE